MLKVAGAENPADLMTKNLDAETMWRHVSRLGFYVEGGRASLAPKLRPGVGDGEVFLAGRSSPPDETSVKDIAGQGVDDGKACPVEMVASSPLDGAHGAAVTPTDQDCPSVACRPVPSSCRVSPANTNPRVGPPSYSQQPSSSRVERSEHGGAGADGEPKLDGWMQVVHPKPRLCLATPLRIEGVPPVRALTAMRVTTDHYISDGVIEDG